MQGSGTQSGVERAASLGYWPGRVLHLSVVGLKDHIMGFDLELDSSRIVECSYMSD